VGAFGGIPRNARYTIFVLFMINCINFVDRQIISILAEPIKNDLHLSDTQLGLLTGLAFAVLYALMAIPIARYADRASTNRVSLIAVCIGIWSIMTSLSGLAASFLLLIVARAVVAIAEAGSAPASYSLISSRVESEHRATAIGYYMVGVPVGRLIGLAAGGLIAAAFGWRTALLAVGLPGVAIALLTGFTLHDPRETRLDKTPKSSTLTVLKDLKSNSTFWWLMGSTSLMGFLSFGEISFIASFFIRQHHIGLNAVGLALGLAIGCGGALGTWLGGTLADRLARHSPVAHLLVPAVAAVAGGVAFGCAVFAADPWVGMVLVGLAATFTSAWYGPLYSCIQTVVAPIHRATAAAINIVAVTLIGNGLGPLFVGALSDGLARGFTLFGLRFSAVGPAVGLQEALAICAIVTLLAAATMVIASQTVERDTKAAMLVG
jgi:predicted MFS family arabinose efflux permease